MHIFYQPDLSQKEILLSEEESKHSVRVLRMKVGDELLLIDGKGHEASAVIKDDNPKKCVLSLRNVQEKKPIRQYYLHVAVAPTKNFDRMEWFIEKAVETGVDEITFIECENSERSRINMERCEKIAISAMKQSKQYWLPKLNGLISVQEFLKQSDSQGLHLIGWCEAETTKTINQHIDTSTRSRITVMIGPEGDFTRQEVELALQYGFRPVSFGDQRLRTETAALYACMAINVLHA